MLPRDTGDLYTYRAGIWPTMGSMETLLTWIPFTLGVVETKSGSSRRSLPGRDRSITGSYKPTPNLNPNLIGSDPVTSPNLK